MTADTQDAERLAGIRAEAAIMVGSWGRQAICDLFTALDARDARIAELEARIPLLNAQIDKAGFACGVAEAKLDRVSEQLGEAIHTAFRKASDHPAANTAWQAIRELPDKDWNAVVEFIKHGLGIAAPASPACPAETPQERRGERTP